MEILNVPRSFGKTINIIEKAIETGYPIIVSHETEKRRIQREAEKIFRKAVTVFTAKEFCDDNFWLGLGRPPKVLIDELPSVLKYLLDSDCEMATMTSKSLEDYDIKMHQKKANS